MLRAKAYMPSCVPWLLWHTDVCDSQQAQMYVTRSRPLYVLELCAEGRCKCSSTACHARMRVQPDAVTAERFCCSLHRSAYSALECADITHVARRWKLTWLPAAGAELVPLTLVDFGYLVTKRKLEDEDVFQDFINEHSVRGAGACTLP